MEHTQPSPDSLEEEERSLRQLQIVVQLTLAVLAQTDQPLDTAEAMVADARRLALRLFPGKELAFDLIYLPRFRRLLAERYGPAAAGSVN
jgi:hypothetical protein